MLHFQKPSYKHRAGKQSIFLNFSTTCSGEALNVRVNFKSSTSLSEWAFLVDCPLWLEELPAHPVVRPSGLASWQSLALACFMSAVCCLRLRHHVACSCITASPCSNDTCLYMEECGNPGSAAILQVHAHALRRRFPSDGPETATSVIMFAWRSICWTNTDRLSVTE